MERFYYFREYADSSENIIKNCSNKFRLEKLNIVSTFLYNYYKRDISLPTNIYFCCWMGNIALDNLDIIIEIEELNIIKLKNIKNFLLCGIIFESLNEINNIDIKNKIIEKLKNYIEKYLTIKDKISIIIKAYKSYKFRKNILCKIVLKKYFPNDIIQKIISM